MHPAPNAWRTYPTAPAEPVATTRLNGFLRAFETHQTSSGNVERISFEHILERDSIECRIDLRGDRHIRHELTAYEIEMGGEQALTHWLRVIDQEIMRANHAPFGGYPQTDHRADAMRYAQMAMTSTVVGRMSWGADDPAEIARKRKADKKAADLFILACGKPAYDTLESGGSIPLTGSKGTAYTLHKRASFCVERNSDGARLCAVVPDVPLYDHLLGIKLMIEGDEPKFLKTANVSQVMAGLQNAQLAMQAQAYQQMAVQQNPYSQVLDGLGQQLGG